MLQSSQIMKRFIPKSLTRREPKCLSPLLYNRAIPFSNGHGLKIRKRQASSWKNTLLPSVHQCGILMVETFYEDLRILEILGNYHFYVNDLLLL